MSIDDGMSGSTGLSGLSSSGFSDWHDSSGFSDRSSSRSSSSRSAFGASSSSSGGGIGLLLVGALILGSITEELSGHVVGQKWSRSVTVHEYVKENREGHRPPYGAKITRFEERDVPCEPLPTSDADSITEAKCQPATKRYFYYTALVRRHVGTYDTHGENLTPYWPSVNADNWQITRNNPCKSAKQKNVAKREGARAVTRCNEKYGVIVRDNEEGKRYVYSARDESGWRHFANTEGSFRFHGNFWGRAFFE